MFAIVQVGSLQYKVSEGDVIETQLLGEKQGDKVTLNQVLLLAEDSNVQIGRPFLKGVTVSAEVMDEYLGEKLISYKYRRRKTSAWKKGHRQKLLSLSIKKINKS